MDTITISLADYERLNLKVFNQQKELAKFNKLIEEHKQYSKAFRDQVEKEFYEQSCNPVFSTPSLTELFSNNKTKTSSPEKQETVSGNTDTTKFVTGAVRSKDADDVRYDLISSIALREIAITYEEGFRKYGAYNWMKGFPASSLINHALRHINLWMDGDRSDRHLAHAAWNILTLIHFEFTRPELNDMKGSDGTPHYKGTGKQ